MKQIRKLPQSRERAWDFLFGTFLIIELVLWSWLNLHYQYVNDHDSAKVLYHTVRMWEEKTLLIPGWKYMTTAEWDCSALLALLFYGITGNILLSFSITNILHVLFFLWILLKLHRNLGLKDRYAYITISAILIPVELGMLSYANMLFYGAAQYIYKTLLPLWLMELLIAPQGSQKKTGWILELLAFSALTFLTAVSSGLYVFLCGLFPIIACLAVFILRDGRILSHAKRIAICLDVFLMTLAGYILQKALGLSTYADEMNLVLLDHFFPKLAANLTDLLRLTKALPLENISLYTPGGIMYVVRFTFLICILCLGLRGLKGWFHGNAPGSEGEQKKVLVCAAFSGLFVWNIFIQQITISSARYHLIGYLPLIVAAGITFASAAHKQTSLVRFTYFSCAVAALAMMMVGCWSSIFSAAGNHYETYYDAVAEIAQNQDADTVVYINDSASAEIARVLDPEHIHVSYYTSNRSLVNYDAYDYYDDRSALTNKHLLIASDLGDLSDLPAYLQSEYTKIGEVFGNAVYMSQTCYLDGTAGPILRRTATDYPYTQGYLFDTAMSEHGVFPKGQERIVLQSPSFDVQSSPIKVTLQYQLEENSQGAWLDVEISGEASQCIALTHEKQYVDFEIAAGKEFSFSIGLSSETELHVEQITFDWL